MIKQFSIALATVAAVAAPAAAAGPYGPTPTGPSGVPGGYSKVVTAVSMGHAGGTVHVDVAGARDTIVVRRGTFDHRVQVEVTEPNLRKLNRGLDNAGLAAFRAVTGLGVKVLNSDGSAVMDRFSKAIVIRVTEDNIHTGQRVVKFTSAAQTRRMAATFTHHTVTFPLHRDPDIAVLTHR